MKKYSRVALIAVLLFGLKASAQDTLPGFSVQNVGTYKVRVSWINPYGARITQLNVQRSYDSLMRFKTIFSSPSPQLPQNGFIDEQAYGRPLYYRIFYVIDDVKYDYSLSKQPGSGTTVTRKVLDTLKALPVARTVSIKIADTVFLKLNYDDFVIFRDSIMKKTRDTLVTLNDAEVALKAFRPKEIWKPSKFVYTAPDGYVNISLPAAHTRHYRLKILSEDGEEIADIKHVKEPLLVLDKGNFMVAGWYHFELYENNVLREKNKFYVWKDF